MNKTFYITTPIYYVNDSPHIGHAYTSLACDFLSRFKKLDGFNVYFLTGTDEHGQKIEKAAKQNNTSPQYFVDKISLRFRELCKNMNFSNNDFIRTTEERHIKYVEKIWKKLVESGDIYLGKYSGWYSTRDEAFYSNDEVIDGKAPTGAPVEWIEEESYFFKLSSWQDKLLKFYEENPDFIAPPSRLHEVLSFIKGGLNDLSVSRTSFSWGIKVPYNEKHVIYVWLDALFNYISAINERNLEYWPCDLHIVGKDILRFHAVYWPAFLMAANLPLPKKVFAHGWWTNNGEKISKSLGNVIDPNDMIAKYGLDYTRYFLMKEINFGNDGNYSHYAFTMRINGELANNIGNLIHRVMTFIYNHCDAQIPQFQDDKINQDDQTLLELAYSTLEKMRSHVNKQEISLAISCIIELSNACNVYMDSNAPWKLRKIDEKRMKNVLAILADCIRIIGILLQPLIPQSASKILNIFNINETQDFISIGNVKNGLSHISNQKIAAPTVIFQKIEIE